MFALRKFTPLLSPAGTTSAPAGGVVGPFSDALPQTAAFAVAVAVLVAVVAVVAVVVVLVAGSPASPLAGVAPPMTTAASATNAIGHVLLIHLLLGFRPAFTAIDCWPSSL
ncbi:hypothetical protein AB0C33_35085 [Nonomuraea sp. NPDC048881]|uniref:hypothetical protein n=1 Tax=Nonomuraea sp. NPDC048881 TaxID=3155030 RepID=UPI0033EA6FF3